MFMNGCNKFWYCALLRSEPKGFPRGEAVINSGTDFMTDEGWRHRPDTFAAGKYGKKFKFESFTQGSLGAYLIGTRNYNLKRHSPADTGLLLVIQTPQLI